MKTMKGVIEIISVIAIIAIAAALFFLSKSDGLGNVDLNSIVAPAPGLIAIKQFEPGTATNCNGIDYRCPPSGYQYCRYQVYYRRNMLRDTLLQPNDYSASITGGDSCYLFGLPIATGTSPTTTLPPVVSIVQKTYRADQSVIVEATTSNIPSFTFATATLSGSGLTKQVSSQVASNKLSFDFENIPANPEGYQISIQAQGASTTATIIVNSVLSIELSTPSSQQYINAPIIVCARISNEDSYQLGLNEIDTLQASARYIGTTRSAIVSSPVFQGKTNLCPWKFSITATENKDLLFTVSASKPGAISATESLSIKVSTASIVVNFIDTLPSGALDVEKTITFETLSPQGSRIRSVNTVTVAEPNGFTVTDVSSQVRELQPGLYIFSFIPTQIEAWTIDVVSEAPGLEIGSGSLLVAISKTETPGDDSTTTPAQELPLTFWIIVATFIAIVYVGSRVKK